MRQVPSTFVVSIVPTQPNCALALFSFWPFLNWFFVHEIQLQVSVLNFSASFLVHEIILGISNLICSLGYNHDLSSLLPEARLWINWFIFETRCDDARCASAIIIIIFALLLKRPFEAKWGKDFGSSCLKESQSSHTIPKSIFCPSDFLVFFESKSGFGHEKPQKLTY